MLSRAQRRVQDLIESSLTALRVNVHSAMNTNAKIIADWEELVDRFGRRRSNYLSLDFTIDKRGHLLPSMQLKYSVWTSQDGING
jgi:hypothetical protein